MSYFYQLLIVLESWVNRIGGLISAVTAIFILLSGLFFWRYRKKHKQILHDSSFREKLTGKLQEYVLDLDKNGLKDIKISLLYCKNYPNNYKNDGYNWLLWVDYFNNNILLDSWIDSTGLFFQEHIWFGGCSVYIDKNSIYVIDKEDNQLLLEKGFQEYKNVVIVMHLPFKHILDINFSEDYPVLYTKFHGSKVKLFDDIIYVRNRNSNDEEYMNIELNMNNQIRKYSKLNHIYFKCKIYIKKLLCFYHK